MSDSPDTVALATALETELRSLASLAPRELRLRLLVAAHTAHLISTDLSSPSRADIADPALVAAIRTGACDGELLALAAKLRKRLFAPNN